MLSESADSSVSDTWGLPKPDSGRSIFWGNHYRRLYVDHPWLILPLQLVSQKLFPHGAGANPATRAAGAAGSNVLCHRPTERCWLTNQINTVSSMISLTPACVIISLSLSLSPSHSSNIFGLIVNIRAESFANGHLFRVALIRYKSSCPPLGLITKWLIKKGFCLLSNKPLTIASKCLVFSVIAGPLGQPKTGIADRREGEDEERGGQNYSALGKEWKRVRF